YVANDGQWNSNAATVTLTVNAVNDAPTAMDRTFGTRKNVSLTLAPFVLGFDVENDPFTAAVVAGPAHGSIHADGDGNLLYVPDTDFLGNDSFTFVLNDGKDSNIGTATIVVVANQK